MQTEVVRQIGARQQIRIGVFAGRAGIMISNGNQRRTHRPEFKARIALEALKGLRPIHQIAAENEIHPVQVSQWKKELQERMAEIFERKNARSDEAVQDQKVRVR